MAEAGVVPAGASRLGVAVEEAEGVAELWGKKCCWGWTRPPPRPIPSHRSVRGLQHCGSLLCAARAFRHRDVDAARLILRNALYADAHGGEMLHFLRHVVHEELTPPTFELWGPDES